MITQHTIALDRLELMLTQSISSQDFISNSTLLNLHSITLENAKEQYNTGACTLHKADECKGNYRLQYHVTVNGIEIGFIKLIPIKPSGFFDNKPLIAFKLNKEILYSAWLDKINTFLTTYNLTVNNITRYEIAVDSNTDSNQLLMNLFFDENIWFMSRNTITNNILEVATLYRDGNKTSSFYIGQRGNLQVVFYNKSLKGHNRFIKNYHQDNGLDINKSIFRVEVRAPRKALKIYQTVYKNNDGETIRKEKYLKLTPFEQSAYTKTTIHRIKPITLEELASHKSLLELFKIDFEKLVDFREKNRVKKEKCTRIKMIDLEQVNTYKVNTIETASMNKDTNLQKRLIKNCLENYKIEKDFYDFQRAVNLSTDYNLTDYFSQQLAKLRIKYPSKQIESEPVGLAFNAS